MKTVEMIIKEIERRIEEYHNLFKTTPYGYSGQISSLVNLLQWIKEKGEDEN